jgi:hypothetical protein
MCVILLLLLYPLPLKSTQDFGVLHDQLHGVSSPSYFSPALNIHFLQIIFNTVQQWFSWLYKRLISFLDIRKHFWSKGVCIIYFRGSNDPRGPRLAARGSAIILRRNRVGRAPMDKLSVPRTDLYMKRNNTHKKNFHAPSGIEPKSPVS